MARTMATVWALILLVGTLAASCNSDGGGAQESFIPTGQIVAVARSSAADRIVVGGTPGTAPAGAEVVVTDLDTSETIQTTADDDGSFAVEFGVGGGGGTSFASLSGASTSDLFRIEIPADGTDVTVGVTLLDAAVSRGIRPVGSVPTDLEMYDGRLYVVNGFSDNVEVHDLSTFPPTFVGTITLPLGQDPVSISFLGGGKAAVANLVGQSVAIVDLDTLECDTLISAVETDPTPCGELVLLPGAFDDPSGVVQAAGKLFVTNDNLGPDFNPNGNGFVTVLDAYTYEVIDLIDSSGANSGYPTLHGGDVWVLNSGNVLFDFDTFTFSCDEAFPPSLDVIDPFTLETVRTIPMPLSAANPTSCLPVSFAVTPDGRYAYLGLGLTAEVVKVDMADGVLEAGLDNPIVITAPGEFNLVSDIVIAPGGLAFLALFNTDEIATLDTLTDTPNPFPFIDPIPAGLKADDPSSPFFEGVQYLALAPDGVFPDLYFVTGISERLGALDTSLILAP